jgi:hypothetical protein
VNIPVGDFNTKLEREGILKPTVGNESQHQDSNDNGFLPLQKI